MLLPLHCTRPEMQSPDIVSCTAAGQCNVQCNPSYPKICATNAGKFCVNLQNNPNFCGSCNKTCPSDTNMRCAAYQDEALCSLMARRALAIAVKILAAHLSRTVNLAQAQL